MYNTPSWNPDFLDFYHCFCETVRSTVLVATLSRLMINCLIMDMKIRRLVIPRPFVLLVCDVAAVGFRFLSCEFSYPCFNWFFHALF